jgi:hypothetical protein
MNITLQLLDACHRCPHRVRPFVPPFMYCIDGRTIHEHAETRECPKGMYSPEALAAAPRCGRCGGTHDVSRCPIPADTSPEVERRRAQAGGCCGPPT